MRTLFFPGLVAQEVSSCQYLRVALLRVANYTASVVLVINLLIEFNPIAPRAMQFQFKVLIWTPAQIQLLSEFPILEDDQDKDSLIAFFQVPEKWTLVFNERYLFADVLDPDGVLTVRLLSQKYTDNNGVMVFQSMMVLPRNHLEHEEGKGWFRNIRNN